MALIMCLLIASQPAQVIVQVDATVSRRSEWTRDFVLAPGDSVMADITFRRPGRSSWGLLGGIADGLLGKNDDVGLVELSSWRGEAVTSLANAIHPVLQWYTGQGGAFTLRLRNTSRHRSNLYSIVVSRVPSHKKWTEFDATFKADTSCDTTWMDEDVFGTRYDTSYVQRSWVDTTYTERPVKLKSGTVSLRGMPGQDKSELNFLLPGNSTGEVGFAFFTDLEKLRRLQEESRQALAAAGKLALYLSGAGAAAGVLLDVVPAVIGSGDGSYSYWLLDGDNREAYGARLPFRFIEKGERVSDQLFSRVLESGKMYYVELYNPALLHRVVVAYEIATTVRDPHFAAHSERVPVVAKREVKTGTRKVPHVEKRVTPRLPWSVGR